MKKILIALLLLGTIVANTFAQEYDVVEAGQEVDFNHNEVYFAAGMPSFLGLFSGMFVAIGEGLAKSLGGENGENDQNKKSNDSVFSVAGGYNYFFNKYVGVGGFATYERFSSLNFMSVQAKITAQYGWEHFKIYQSVSGGIMVISGADKPNFIFDVTYLGLKADFENWNVFIDASIPSTGIIKAGASFKF